MQYLSPIEAVVLVHVGLDVDAEGVIGAAGDVVDVDTRAAHTDDRAAVVAVLAEEVILDGSQTVAADEHAGLALMSCGGVNVHVVGILAVGLGMSRVEHIDGIVGIAAVVLDPCGNAVTLTVDDVEVTVRYVTHTSYLKDRLCSQSARPIMSVLMIYINTIHP